MNKFLKVAVLVKYLSSYCHRITLAKHKIKCKYIKQSTRIKKKKQVPVC